MKTLKLPVLSLVNGSGSQLRLIDGEIKPGFAPKRTLSLAAG